MNLFLRKLISEMLICEHALLNGLWMRASDFPSGELPECGKSYLKELVHDRSRNGSRAG